MALKLLISKRRVVHVEGCIRLTGGAYPAIIEVWDGTGQARACHTCMVPRRRRRPLPCPRCQYKIGLPCPHNGVLRAIEVNHRGSAARSIRRSWNFPDLALERDWLLSLLDS